MALPLRAAGDRQLSGARLLAVLGEAVRRREGQEGTEGGGGGWGRCMDTGQKPAEPGASWIQEVLPDRDLPDRTPRPQCPLSTGTGTPVATAQEAAFHTVTPHGSVKEGRRNRATDPEFVRKVLPRVPRCPGGCLHLLSHSLSPSIPVSPGMFMTC